MFRDFLIGRLKEKSTWTGLFMILSIPMLEQNPEIKAQVITALCGIGGVVLMLTQAKKKDE